MWKNENIFRKAIVTAINHKKRVAEGKELLEQGKPLSEMKTPLAGLSQEETQERRQEYVNWVESLDETKLRFTYKNVMHQLEARYDDPERGTSELELERIIFEDEFRKRKIKP